MPGAFPHQAELYAQLRLPLLLHIAGGIAAILAGPWQFWGTLRVRRPYVHRWIGRAYLMGVAVGAAGGLFMAQYAYGGVVTQLGFSALALTWASTSFMAYRAIRTRDVAAHRRWMVRSYAVTLAFVFLRLWLPTLVAAGVPFDEAYRAVAWLCWVPNVLVAEAYLGAQRAARRPTT